MAVEEEHDRNINNLGCTRPQKMSAYELSRERRIRENLERMQKMGILNLTRNLRASSGVHKKQGSSSAAAKQSKEDGTETGSRILQPTPLRRSSRLQNATPVTYSDILLSGTARKGTKHKTVTNAVVDKKIVLQQGPRPEVYTEEHEKLLGGTERSWELFVDGYGKDGRRIYDPFNGKTCHQCRQKTLGHRTECSQCGMVQGQFCGDCLYMRYGEHVLEALENPNWICPVCRGICNCSLCRQAKGWAPTGALYRKISNMGFKSVAHYLIETRRFQLKLETNADSPAHFSVKRSLPFSNLSSVDPPEGNIGEIKPFDIDPKEVDNSSLTKDGGFTGQVSTKRTSNFFSDGSNAKAVKSLDHQKGDGKQSEDQGIVAASISVLNDSGQVKKLGAFRKLKPDSIGGRSRSRKSLLCFLPNDSDAEPGQPPVDQKGSDEQNKGQADSSVTKSSKQAKNHDSCSEVNHESIGGRLKLRKRSLCFFSDGNNSAEPEKVPDHGNGSEDLNEDLCIAVTDSLIANSSNEVEKHSCRREPGEDSIGGRLRLRKNILLLT